MARLKTGVLISGSGTNLQALLDHAADPDFPAEIVAVISNRPHAPGLKRAAAARVAARVIDHTEFSDREGFDAALNAALIEAGCEFLCLAGFMRVLSRRFVEAWRNRLVNIHPSLLPSFRGLNAQAQAIAAGVRIAGCTVHFVRAETDSGPIIVQGAVPVLDGDNAQTLAERILAVEHQIYPMALRMIAEGRVRVEGDRVRILGSDSSPDRALIAPCDGGRP